MQKAPHENAANYQMPAGNTYEYSTAASQYPSGPQNQLPIRGNGFPAPMPSGYTGEASFFSQSGQDVPMMHAGNFGVAAAQRIGGTSTVGESIGFGDAKPKTSKSVTGQHDKRQWVNGRGQATKPPAPAYQRKSSSSSGAEAPPELLERWEKTRVDNPDPVPWRILMEKENGKDKLMDIYVKLPVEHVIRALQDQGIVGNASGGRAENVLVPAKISTSIATSSREVFRVATVAQDAAFVTEPAPEQKFSKEEIDQINRTKRSKAHSTESHKQGKRTERGGYSDYPTYPQHTGQIKAEGSSFASSSSLNTTSFQSIPSFQTPVEMASPPNGQPDAKRAKLMELKDEFAGKDEDIVMEDKEEFSILGSFLRNAELTLELAKHLRIQELISLYSISKDFHQTVNNHLTTTLVAQAQFRAPESAAIFPFRCYARLCIDDPAGRPHPVEKRAAEGEVRKVPSLRWLKMVCYREMVCHDIMIMMANGGQRLPGYCELVLKKLWFLMDVPDNARRISIIQNRDIWADIDIFFAIMLFIKMDMRFTNPVKGSGRDGLRRLLLSQRGLTMFWKTLNRTALTSSMDVTEAYVRWKYTPRENEINQPIFNVPAGEVGRLQYEGWGRAGNNVKLERPDELILMEAVHRQMGIQRHYMEMCLWGLSPTAQRDESGQWRRLLPRLEGFERELRGA